VRSILEILVEMLATPSEPVQRAVSDCMPALMPGLSADRPYVETLVARLLKQLGHESYGHRCVSARHLHGILERPSRAAHPQAGSCRRTCLPASCSAASRGIVQVPLCSCAVRRGAAFGVAGMVKGLGIAALRGYGVLDALRAGVEDKSSAAVREGALFAFQALVEKLGRMFEPYVVQVLLCAEG